MPLAWSSVRKVNAVDYAETFLDRFARFSCIGSTGDGGVDRVEGSQANGEARRQLVQWMKELGFTVSVDTIGNIFGLLNLAGESAPLVLTGSHIDSQPRGGCFDGAYGVIAGLDAAVAVRDRLAKQSEASLANLGVVAWMGEEGARFRPLMGSRVYTGARTLQSALDGKDLQGISAREALTGIGFLGTDTAPKLPAAYVELHVECGSQLEARKKSLGVFTRWWGAHKVDLMFEGKTAHTGPTPMRERQDALYAAAQVIVAMRALGDSAEIGSLHTSVAKLEVVPNSPNVVPCGATAYVELRSLDPEVIKRSYDHLLAYASFAATTARVKYTITRDDLREPGKFHEGLSQLAFKVAKYNGEEAVAVDTLGGHDAIMMAAVCPTVMLTVPSRAGLCHHPDEWTAQEDLGKGMAWLSAVLERMITAELPL